MTTTQHTTPRVGVVETRGIDAVPDEGRHGGVGQLFWMWFAANMGILGITLGAVLVTVLGLSVPQAMLAAALGSCVSFLAVGLLSLGGRRTGVPGLTLSRATFGIHGNRLPTALTWLSFVGWESVMCTTAAFALLAVLHGLGVDTTTPVTVAVVLVCVAIAAVIGVFGHATVLWVEKWLTWIFGAFTLVVVAFIATRIDLSAALSLPNASASHVVAGVGLIAAGTGVGWLAAGADYTRYLPRTVPASRIVGATVTGAGIPLVALIGAGAFMATGDPALVAAPDPVAAIGAWLPGWMLVPYLLTAAAGLLAAADLAMYSSGLTLIAAGVRIPRTWAVLLDAVLITLAALYVTVVAQDFIGPFTAFLTLLAIPLAAWGAVVGVDLARRRPVDVAALYDPSPTGTYRHTRGIAWPALGSWLLGIVTGLAFSAVRVGETTFVAGPLAETWVGVNGLGWFVAAAIAALAYALLHRLRPDAAA